MNIIESSSPVRSAEAISNFSDFDYERVLVLSSTVKLPLVLGRVLAGDAAHANPSVECLTYEEFTRAVQSLQSQIEFLVYDESFLDEALYAEINQELSRIVSEYEPGADRLMSKVMTALKAHLNTAYSVTAYALLKSGRIVFYRCESDLAAFLAWPERLLTQEGLDAVRKLKTLGQ